MFLLISDYLGDDDEEASNKPCFPPLVSSDTILAFGMFLFVISVILRFGRIMMTMEQTSPTLANLKKLAKG